VPKVPALKEVMVRERERGNPKNDLYLQKAATRQQIKTKQRKLTRFSKIEDFQNFGLTISALDRRVCSYVNWEPWRYFVDTMWLKRNIYFPENPFHSFLNFIPNFSFFFVSHANG